MAPASQRQGSTATADGLMCPLRNTYVLSAQQLLEICDKLSYPLHRKAIQGILQKWQQFSGKE
jgi:hypothetical protein